MSPTRAYAHAGQSTLEVEEPDLVIYRLRGILQGSELKTLREADGAWNHGRSYLLVLVDITEQVEATYESRKVSMEPAIGTKNRAIAIFGGGSTVRMFADLTMRALRLLTKGNVNNRFFNNEAEARQWLYSQREFMRSRVDAA